MSLHYYFDKPRNQIYYWVSCDNCGSTDGVGREFSARTIRTAEARRFRRGWVKDHTYEKYYCPDCAKHLGRLFRQTIVRCCVCGKTSELTLAELGEIGWRESNGCIICPDCKHEYMQRHTGKDTKK